MNRTHKRFPLAAQRTFWRSLPSSARTTAIILKRQQDGLCRCCGGPTPCWSIFGDSAPGKLHTRVTYERMLEARNAEVEGVQP